MRSEAGCRGERAMQVSWSFAFSGSFSSTFSQVPPASSERYSVSSVVSPTLSVWAGSTESPVTIGGRGLSKGQTARAGRPVPLFSQVLPLSRESRIPSPVDTLQTSADPVR